MPRKQLPIRQRHRDDCRGPRDCDCAWSFRVRLPDGTMPRVTRDTYTEAEQAYHELMARRPEPLADRTTTIADLAQRWVASGPSLGLRPNTLHNRSQVVRNHILNAEYGLGHYLVTELRPDDVRLWVARMQKCGARNTRQAVAVLRTMYGDWHRDDRLLPHGIPVPARLVKAKPRKEWPSPTAAQVAAWAAAMPADWKLIVEAEAFYGGRVSEILALREEDILFTGKDVTAPLGRQLAHLAALPADKYGVRSPRVRFQRKLEQHRRHGEPAEGSIKNARGNRTLPVPQWLAAALAAHLEHWPAVDGWLFTNHRAPGGCGTAVADIHPKPILYGTFARRMRRAAREAGIMLPPNQCTHALRHYCVSELKDKGWDPDAIGLWIGDSGVTVAEVYGRPMPDVLDRIAGEMSAARDAGPRLRAVD